MSQKVVPNLFIVGVAKAATTSLYKYLQSHKDIYFPEHKEPNFLSAPYKTIPHNGPGDDISDSECIYDEEVYFNLFRNRTEKIIGEASVDYLYFYKTADQIARLNPQSKIIICLRNPIDRAFSAYWHLVNDGREKLSFEEALEKEEERKRENFEYIWCYKESGMYYEKVKYYIDTFGRQNVYILIYEDFVRSPEKYVSELFDFLGVENINYQPEFQKNNPSGIPKSKIIHNLVRNQNIFKTLLKKMLPINSRQKIKAKILNKNLKKPIMDIKTRENLTQFFKNDVKNSEKITALNLNHWLR